MMIARRTKEARRAKRMGRRRLRRSRVSSMLAQMMRTTKRGERTVWVDKSHRLHSLGEETGVLETF
jgi:hypothetical protein